MKHEFGHDGNRHAGGDDKQFARATLRTEHADEPASDWDNYAEEDYDISDRDGDLAFGGPPRCVDPSRPWGYLMGFHKTPPSAEHDSEFAVDSDANDDERGGVFRGRWRSPGGRLDGFVVGHSEPVEFDGSDDEPRVFGRFYGKVVDRDGRFHGYLRGVHGRSVHGVGVFRGQYFDVERRPVGGVFGRWSDGPMHCGGPFFGVWSDRRDEVDVVDDEVDGDRPDDDEVASGDDE